MQRNMDLVRMVLMKLEACPSGWAPADLEITSFPEDQIGYHAHIMLEEGLITACDVTHLESPGPEAVPTGLTWKGHEFLELARDQDR
jgi:Hypothetical protein (DUF2513)